MKWAVVRQISGTPKSTETEPEKTKPAASTPVVAPPAPPKSHTAPEETTPEPPKAPVTPEVAGVAEVKEPTEAAQPVLAGRRSEVCLAILDFLQLLDQELVRLRDEIREIHPRAEGAITLDLSPCQRSCLGCPHPRWAKVMIYRKASGEGRVKLQHVKNPLRRVRRSGEYSEIAPRLRELIKEAERIIQKRAEVIDYLSRLNKKVQMSRR